MTTIRVYELGKWREASMAELESKENERRNGGHQPWREDVLLSARAFSLNLCGIEVPLDDGQWNTEQSKSVLKMTAKQGNRRIQYELKKHERDTAFVILSTTSHRYRLTLRRPIKSDWYITSIEQIKGNPKSSGKQGR